MSGSRHRHPVHKSTGTIPPEMFRAIAAPFDPSLYGADAHRRRHDPLHR
ncbi:MAG: hypothetical protein M0C28_18425 [Candidatus Moduliflexus flocculans]|nr:hypothetical protein [Candidatus Moduliflexus flocculans]